MNLYLLVFLGVVLGFVSAGIVFAGLVVWGLSTIRIAQRRLDASETRQNQIIEDYRAFLNRPFEPQIVISKDYVDALAEALAKRFHFPTFHNEKVQ